MAQVKIAYIGGGSYKAAPKILGDLLLTKGLNGSTIVLHDIDGEALDTMRKLSVKMKKKAGSGCNIVTSGDRAAALEGADFVITAITVGGFEAFRKDIEVPLNHGIYQSQGDCVGPGGISRSLRTLPVFMEIVKDIDRICPKAWLINLTEPVGTICRLISKVSSVKLAGISDELAGTIALLKKILRARNNNLVNVTIGGINRLGWILDVNLDREDVNADLARHIQNRGRNNKGGNKGGGGESHLVKFDLFCSFGYLPYGEDRRIAEFFPYFLNQDTRKGERYGIRPVNLKKMSSDVNAQKEKIKRAANSGNPVNFSKTQSEMADVIATLANRNEGTYVLNVPNRGSLANLPLDAITEVSVFLKNGKISEPVIEDLPSGLLGTIIPQVLIQDLLVEACLKGNRGLVLQALLLDPLVRSLNSAEKILDQILKVHRKFLPQFYM